jgi:hypothetical protein
VNCSNGGKVIFHIKTCFTVRWEAPGIVNTLTAEWKVKKPGITCVFQLRKSQGRRCLFLCLIGIRRPISVDVYVTRGVHLPVKLFKSESIVDVYEAPVCTVRW